MKVFPPRFNSQISRVAIVGALLVGVLQGGLAANENPRALLESGIGLFRQGDYEAALSQLRLAADKQPDDVQAQMWLGLALQADGHEWEAMSAWRSGTGNPKWEPIADYLRGLSWWKMKSTKDAINYFKDAELNIKDGKAVSFPPAREALRRLNAGESAPDISRWPDLSTLSQAEKTAVTSTTQKSSAAAKPVAQKTTAAKSTAKKPAAKKPVASPKNAPTKKTGAKPRSGKWVATIQNGYKGDTLTFRVSADGKRIEKVEFKGYWVDRSSSSGIGPQILRDLDPPKPFVVTGGAFSAVQQVPKSRMWWEFRGSFTSATSAKGTYRCAYAGGQNDTYELKWTARYVGS